MIDIVERLRLRADENYEMLGNIHEPLLEAADEIERLRAALEDIADGLGETDLAEVGRYAKHIARAALEGRT